MKEIKEAVFNHITLDTDGALLITGEWGIGKTYYIKKILSKEIKKETKYTPLVVSIYGENSIENISNKILHAVIDAKGAAIKLKSGKITKIMEDISSVSPFLKKYVDIEKLMSFLSGGLFNALSGNKIIIFFDDIERKGDDLKLDDFLGYVNELTENKECKIVLVTNQDKIKGEFSFREKTIEKTIYFLPDREKTFFSLVSKYKKNIPFYNFIHENKELFLITLFPQIKYKEDEGYKEYKDLISSLSNFRLIKSVLEHFQIVFDIVNHKRETKNRLVKNQLASIWSFILGVVMESRGKGNLTFEDSRGLAKYTPSFMTFTKKQKAGYTKDEDVYAENFYYNYYNVDHHSYSNYHFYMEIYQFILAGSKMDESALLKGLDVKFKVEGKKMKAPYKLLERLNPRSIIAPVDDDIFPDVLAELLGYVKNRGYESINDYLIAMNYILTFKDYFSEPKKSKDLIRIFKNTLKIWISEQRYFINLQGVRLVDMETINKRYEKEIKEFINTQIQVKKREKINDEIKNLHKLLNNSIKELLMKLTQKNHLLHLISDKNPIFSYFTLEQLAKSIEKITIEETKLLSFFLKTRYSEKEFVNGIVEEFPVMIAFAKHISNIDTSKKILSNYMIETKLKNAMKLVTKVIQEHPEYENLSIES